ncbi:MAG: alpha/beta hydrolase [Nitrosomonas sp.]|jgi:pimeloyl-ACP methyl ester carboxylesterase|nr:alpha/beta hydrolase [Nitrosomonas sp.]MBP9101812.1 alpha/beta hydrolase [Nitrosomonas sp.]
MQHTTRFRILFVTIVIATTFIVFALGPLLTAPAPTAVSTLSADFPVESVEIPSQQGVTVHGWLARGKPGGGVLLLVHSMRSNRMEMLSRARFLKDQGYSVLFIDLQAHGETAGDHITFGLREAENVEASVAFLRKTFPAERMGAIGASLGAAAIVLAQQNLKLDAVILESLHPTLEEAVDNRLKLHFGDQGSILLPLMLWQLSFYLDVSLDALSPITRINNLNAPVLFISGTHDVHTTQPETERLYTAARFPKELWIVPGAQHFNMHSYAGREYEQRVSDFLSYYLRPHDDG